MTVIAALVDLTARFGGLIKGREKREGGFSLRDVSCLLSALCAVDTTWF